MNKKRARVTGIVRLVAAVLLLAILLVTLSITGIQTTRETGQTMAMETEADR